MTKSRIGFLFFALIIGWYCAQEPPVRIFLIGDSTMANKPLDGNPERGWGQMLGHYFKQNVTVHNHARNGRSTKSFIDEGLWQIVVDSLKRGDYVMIQFGHNDQKISDSTRYAAPHEAYRHNLERFVNESREKGATGILITPVMRRRFDESGHFYDTHGEYPGVVRTVAEEMKVPLIDLHQSSEELIKSLGVENSKKIFLWVEPGQFDRFPDGKQDNTHFSESGASTIAGLVVKDLKTLDIDLRQYINEKGVQK